MISAKKALATRNKEEDVSLRYRLRQVDRMIKSAKEMNQDTVVLTFITDPMIDALIEKGYRVYAIKGSVRVRDCKDNSIEYVERIPLYVIRWGHAK